MKYTKNPTSSHTGDINNGEIGVNAPITLFTISDNGTNGVGHRHKSASKKHPQCDDPNQIRDESYGTTATGALLHLLKSSIGSGILAMSNGFKNGGLIFGLVGTVLIGLLCSHCIYLLVVCSQSLARRTNRPALGFSDTALMAFETGPRRFRKWAKFASEFVNAALFCTYYFGNCVYVILISASLKQVADSHSSPEWQFSIRTWILGLAIPLLPLGCIRSLRLLVPFSAIATSFILVGLGSTMVCVIMGTSPFSSYEVVTLPDIWSRPWIAPVSQMPLFFTTVLFAMEGIGIVLPIENSMRQPQRFLTARPCGVLTAAMSLVLVLYTSSGFFGYLRFGEASEGSITLNLPNDLFSEAVKVMVALSIVFSYGLQFCVPSEIAWARLEPWLRKRRQNRKNAKCSIDDNETSTVVSSIMTIATSLPRTSVTHEVELKQLEKPFEYAYYVMRAVMILITFLIAAIVPNLAPIISLFGSVFFSILGLLCPAVIHLVTFWEQGIEDSDCSGSDENNKDDTDVKSSECDDNDNVVFNDSNIRFGNMQSQHCINVEPSTRHKIKGLNRWAVVSDVAIVLIAVVALFSGSYASIQDILQSYVINDKL